MANTKSMDFEEDSSQYLSITDANQTGLALTGDQSYMFWVKPESIVNLATLLSKFDAGQSDRAYSVNFNSSGNLIMTYSVDGLSSTASMRQFTSSVALSTGVWTHVAITFDLSADDCKFYFNGAENTGASKTYGDSGALASVNDNNDPFRIGADSSNGAVRRFFDGKFDEIGIYDAVLSEATVQADYNSGDGTTRSSSESNIVAGWRFEDDLLDVTSNNNDLTNNNSATFSTDVPFGGSTPPASTFLAQILMS